MEWPGSLHSRGTFADRRDVFEAGTPTKDSPLGLGWLSRMPPPIAGCWYLDNHWDPKRRERTPTGDLLYEAKTYGQKIGQPNAARTLAEQMAAAAMALRSTGPFPFDRVDIVVPVPANPPKIPHNLPNILASRVASAIGKPCLRESVVKTRPTAQAKTRQTVSPDAYATNLVLRDDVVLIVDDVVMSGGTLAALGRVLRSAGAGRIAGFVGTRAKKGLWL